MTVLSILKSKIFPFLCFFALIFPTRVSANTQPHCEKLSVTHQPSDSEPYIIVFANTGFLADGDLYEFVFQQGAEQDHRGLFSGNDSKEVRFDINIAELHDHNATISVKDYPDGLSSYCSQTIQLDSGSGGIIINPGDQPEPFSLCKQAGVNETICSECLKKSQIWTGLGCIPFDTQTNLVRSLITIGLSITGTVVVLMTLYAGFMFSTSQGDPKRVDEAKSAVTSAIVGAFFIIFSVTILQFVGVRILQIPGFG